MLGNPQFAASACATPTVGAIVVATSASLDTDTGASTPSGVTCVRVANGAANLCAIVAPSIVIDSGVKLSAHGSLPLALFAHSITIRGTLDVASHVLGAVAGAGSYTAGCATGTLAKLAGGGTGGGNFGRGGDGGDQGGVPATGGQGGFSFGITHLIGGCAGTRGGDGSVDGGSATGAASGGAGGGAVWLVSDTSDLVLEAGAVINASGAGGGAGTIENHGGGGGGAGGLIVLQAPHIRLDPAAQLFANGGHGGGGAGINSTQPGYMGGTAGTDPTGPTSGGGGGAGGVDGVPPAVTGRTGAVDNLAATVSVHTASADGLPPAVSGLAGSSDAHAPSAGSNPGDGGTGYPAPDPDRKGLGGGAAGRGGGGGGGGEGAIRVISATVLASSNVSPPPLNLR